MEELSSLQILQLLWAMLTTAMLAMWLISRVVEQRVIFEPRQSNFVNPTLQNNRLKKRQRKVGDSGKEDDYWGADNNYIFNEEPLNDESNEEEFSDTTDNSIYEMNSNECTLEKNTQIDGSTTYDKSQDTTLNQRVNSDEPNAYEKGLG